MSHRSKLIVSHRTTLLVSGRSTLLVSHGSTLLVSSRSTLLVSHRSTLPVSHRSTLPVSHESTLPVSHRCTLLKPAELDCCIFNHWALVCSHLQRRSLMFVKLRPKCVGSVWADGLTLSQALDSYKV